MDMLQRARDLFDGADGDGSRQDALCSIAAALIAQAEANREMLAYVADRDRAFLSPRFVQIGGRCFRPNEILGISDLGQCVLVHLARGVGMTFTEDSGKRAAFLRWWNEHASIERLDAPDA